jgi:signal transduction histidine kinase
MTYPLLEERIEERTRELEALLEVSKSVAATLDMDALLDTLFDQLSKIVAYDGVSVSLREGETALVLLAYRIPAAERPLTGRWDATDSAVEVLGHLVEIRAPIIIPDVMANTNDAAVWRDSASRTGRGHAGVRTWMGVPLLAGQRNIGMMTLEHREANYYTSHHAELAMALANQLAIAIENARLFRAVQRGADQFRVISELGQRISSILDIDELLTQAVHLIREAFGYYHVHIGLIEDDMVILSSQAGVYEDEPCCNYCSSLNLSLGDSALCSVVADKGEPVLVPDISQEPRYLHPSNATGSGVIVPLIAKGRVIGLLDVEHREVNVLTKDDVAVLQLLANQVAIAIENARLYGQAQKLAALQERQKLARELHDSVSQALYGIGLGTKTAISIMESAQASRETLAQPLDYILGLATSALAEMRALIFELRPESLEVEGLLPALARRVDVLRSRSDIEVTCSLDEEPDVPVAAKEALYRVAQEALHNVGKHANASLVAISLASHNGDVTLEIGDDGSGFELREHYPGHLGLRSMRERVEALGGAFAVDSAPGQGTRIRASVPRG